MRVIKGLVLVGLGFKVMVLGLWWWDSVARAERPAKMPEAAADAAESVVPRDLLARSRGFRDLLDAVRQRGQELDEREQAIKARAAALDALEKTVAEEVARLEGLVGAKGPAPAASEATAPVPARDAGLSVGVTKIYESMKAEEAAPILDRLDDTTAKAILARMKEKQIGAILAAMNRDRAVALTKALAAGS